MSSRIEDYAVIGDCETVALVSRGGSVDWLCWPRFDSPACFAALLGTPEHGRWLISPQDAQARSTRRYRNATLVLETDHETAEGVVTVIDFMPLRGVCSDLVRLVVGKRGRVDMRTELVIRFGYGIDVPWVRRLDDGTLIAISGPDMVTLRTPIPLRGEGMKTVGEFTIEAGQTIPLVLAHTQSHLTPPVPFDALEACNETETFWSGWSAKCTHAQAYSDAVVRSLITLKALTYAPTGGIIAAPTTSLPEAIGGARNWDYRYCWLRDSTQTLRALMDAGYYEEAGAWRDWLLRAVAGSPSQMQIMYGIAGERRLTEWEVPWLPGYDASRPVRIGNAAHDQLQLDMIGEVIDTLHQAGLGGLSHDDTGWDLQRELLAHLEKTWAQPDAGIWEIRGPPRHFTYSKVMAWVAFDRAIKSAETFGLSGPIEHWQLIRQAIHDEVCQLGVDTERGCFTQAYGSRELDASLLLLPAVGFLPPDDPRMRATIEAIERDLTVDGFVMRYDTRLLDDGLTPGEGAFLACSFWMADALLLLGRNDDAVSLFERLLALRNDVGLLSEEFDVKRGRLVGNFPQAFSCIALVNTAYNIAQAQKTADIPDRAVRTGETGS